MNNNKVVLFEFYGGFGCQRKSMIRDGYEIVDSYLIERDIDATIAYATMHLDLYSEMKKHKTEDKEKYINYLESFGYCKNDKLYNLSRMQVEKLKQLYYATILSKNFGDVENVTPKILDNIIKQHDNATSFASWSTPCQDFSNAGKRKGFDGMKGNLTHYTVNIFKQMKTRFDYLLFENVPAIMDKSFIHGFNSLLFELQKISYYNKHFKLNAKNYGIPQNRNRVFIVSSTDEKFYFEKPKPIPLMLKLKDMLETNVTEKYYLSEQMLQYMTDDTNRNGFVRADRFNPLEESAEFVYTITTNPGNRPTDNFIKVREGTQKGYKEAFPGDGIVLNFVGKARGAVQSQSCPTLLTEANTGVITSNLKIRRLTPLECMRLMGFDDEDYYKLKQMGFADSVIYKMCGNGIVVNVLQHINNNIFNPKKSTVNFRNIVQEQSELF